MNKRTELKGKRLVELSEAITRKGRDLMMNPFELVDTMAVFSTKMAITSESMSAEADQRELAKLSSAFDKSQILIKLMMSQMEFDSVGELIATLTCCVSNSASLAEILIAENMIRSVVKNNATHLDVDGFRATAINIHDIVFPKIDDFISRMEAELKIDDDLKAAKVTPPSDTEEAILRILRSVGGAV